MSGPIRLLLVEDNPGDCDFIHEILPAQGSESFVITDIPRLAAAIQAAEEESYDVVLLDLGLPDSAGLGTLRAMRTHAPDLPIVVITGNADESAGLEAIQEGAQDFVLKGHVTGAYLSKVLGFARERHEISRRLQESEERLYQSQKMEALGQLAGGIAHDFNNLLTAILGYSELLLTRPELADSAARAEVDEIRRAAERAAGLTHQILAFSRRQTLRPRVVSINEVLAGMEPLLFRTLGEDIDLMSSPGADAGTVEIDVHQFEQVILNLAVNARDAMRLGGRLTLETGNVELSAEYCRAHPEVSPGDYVMLAVTDTGSGMDDVTRGRVFEPFFTTKGPGEGTGLGLATVYGIVKQSGGSITVYSEVGEGTCFKIYLPRAGAPSGAGTQKASAPGEATFARGDETILVVEDEEALRALVLKILGGLGYRVLCAGTASEALEIFAAADAKIDLLLADLVLPGGMQGSELATQLLSQTPGLRVLYMSGYTRNGIVHAGRLDDGVCFLEKPFTPDGLATAVRCALYRV